MQLHPRSSGKAEMLQVCDDDFSARGQRDNPRVLQAGKLAAYRFKSKTKKIGYFSAR